MTDQDQRKGAVENEAPTNSHGDNGHSGCVDIADIGGQTFIQLPDGSYHGLGPGNITISEARLQSQLEAKGIARLSNDAIAELREVGYVV